LKVLLFAAARQRVGAGSVDLELELPASMAGVRLNLGASYPDPAGLGSTSRWAVDQCFVDEATIVQGNEEVALIPPVSGG